MSNRARLGLTEQGEIVLTTVNQFGEHNMVVLSKNEAEELLYDLHSLVMTIRGQDLPAKKKSRFSFLR